MNAFGKRIETGKGQVVGLVVHTGFVRGNHILDVDESIVPAVALKQLQRLVNQVPDVLSLLLGIVDSVASVLCK